MEVASAAATGVVSTVVALGEISAGESEAEDETEEKLVFFLKNSSLRHAFLLWVEGLVRFFPRVEFTLLSREKKLMVRFKLKSLPWLVSVWQKDMVLTSVCSTPPDVCLSRCLPLSLFSIKKA